MYTWNVKTSCTINSYYQPEASEWWPVSREKRESEISRLNEREREITRLLRACHAEQNKPGKTQDAIKKLNIEIKNILDELDNIRKKSAELRDQRWVILWKSSNLVRKFWDKAKDISRPLSVVTINSRDKLEQARVLSDKLESEKRAKEKEAEKKKNDLAFLSLHQNPLLSTEKKSEDIKNIPAPNAIDMSQLSEDVKKTVEKQIESIVEIKKVEIKTEENKIIKEEILKAEEKQTVKVKETNEIFTKILDWLPENEQEAFINILRIWLSNEEESILESPNDDRETLQNQVNIYSKIYSNFVKHVWGEFLEQFKKSKNKDTPLWQEIQNHLKQKNLERDIDQPITDSDIESLKNDSDFLQIFVANSSKLEEYKIPEWTYNGIFDKNIGKLMWSVNSWYGDNMGLIGIKISKHNTIDNGKKLDVEMQQALDNADLVEQELHAKKEDIIRQIGHLESDIASTDAILESMNICRSSWEDSSINITDINNMDANSERPMICFDHDDTPVLYFINKKWEHTMIMLFSNDNPIYLTGNASEIKNQMDMIVDMQKYPILSSFVHTPRLLSETYDACRSRYPEKDPKDPNNQIMIKFIMESIYGAAGMDMKLTSENIGSEMNRISQDSYFTKNIKSELIAWWFFDPMSWRINDRILSTPNPPDLSLV